MLSKDVANIIISLHVLTGSDHTSGFYGHGKKTVAKTDQRRRDKTAARTGWRESRVTRRSQSRYESIRLVQSLQ